MYINEAAVGSQIKLDVTIGDKKLEFETSVIKKDNVNMRTHFCRCEPVRSEDGKPISFGKYATLAALSNADNGREYIYHLDKLGYNKDHSELLLYSGENVAPINHRKAYRVPCDFDSELTIGRSSKVKGQVHDISFTGISFVFVSGSFKDAVINSPINASLYDDKGTTYKVSGRIVRIVENYSFGRNLIGVQFDAPSNAIIALIAALQRKELRVRGDRTE